MSHNRNLSIQKILGVLKEKILDQDGISLQRKGQFSVFLLMIYVTPGEKENTCKILQLLSSAQFQILFTSSLLVFFCKLMC